MKRGMERSHYEKFRELRRKLRVHIGHGLRTGIELYERESPAVPQ